MADHGWPVVDADRVAHELYVPHSPVVSELVTAFSQDVLHPDGTVNRDALGRLVFTSAEARETLNRIVHSRLVLELQRRLAALEAHGARIAVLEAALLLQWDPATLVDIVVGVWAPRETRLLRLVAGGLSPEAAALRVDLQVGESQLRVDSDVLIENDGSLAALECTVRSLLQDLERRATST